MSKFSISIFFVLLSSFSNIAFATSITSINCTVALDDSWSPDRYISGPIELTDGFAEIHLWRVYKNNSVAYMNEKELLDSGLSADADFTIKLTKENVAYSVNNLKTRFRGNGSLPFISTKNGKYEASPFNHANDSLLSYSPYFHCEIIDQVKTVSEPSLVLNQKFKVKSCKGNYYDSDAAYISYLNTPNKINAGDIVELISASSKGYIFKINSNAVGIWNYSIFVDSPSGELRSEETAREDASGFTSESEHQSNDGGRYQRGLSIWKNPTGSQKWQLETYDRSWNSTGQWDESATCGLDEIY